MDTVRFFREKTPGGLRCNLWVMTGETDGFFVGGHDNRMEPSGIPLTTLSRGNWYCEMNMQQAIEHVRNYPDAVERIKATVADHSQKQCNDPCLTREQLLQVEIERLRAWLYKIKNEAYKGASADLVEYMAEQSIDHSACAAHPALPSNFDWPKLGTWPPAVASLPEDGERPKATYRPFRSAEEFSPYREHWICSGDGTRRRVYHYSDKGVNGMLWEVLFRTRTFENGEPCGVKL